MTDKESLLRAARYAIAEYLRLCKRKPTSCMVTMTDGSVKIVKFDDVLVYLSELIEEEAKRK